MSISVPTRSPVEGTPIRYTATFTCDQIEKAKVLAQKRGHSVSQVLRDLVALGLLCEGDIRETSESRVSGVTEMRNIKVIDPMFVDPSLEAMDVLAKFRGDQA